MVGMLHSWQQQTDEGHASSHTDPAHASRGWYEKRTFESTHTSCCGIPRISNKNWTTGNTAKMDRAKQWGHWFFDEDKECKQHAN
jgi:hypothetical protein